MAIVVAIDDVPAERIKHSVPPGPGGKSTTFFGRLGSTRYVTAETPNVPEAMLAQHNPGERDYSSHFHITDEFQVIVEGKGMMGRHEVAPYHVHFARAYTPYGPLQADKETGWAFLTMRARPGGGAQRNAQDKLKAMKDRSPWQAFAHASFPPPSEGVSFKVLPELRDDQGLFAYALTMPPNTQAAAPDPSIGDGQFLVVLKGSLVHDGREHKSLTIAFVEPKEGALQLKAGNEGLQALVLNLPQVKQSSVPAPLPAAGHKWQCTLCSFVYDEELGSPSDNIAAGTRWQDVPEDWNCPDCLADKSDFELRG